MSFNTEFSYIIEENLSGLLSCDPSWERVELGKVANIVNGFAFNSQDFDNSVGLPLVRIRDIVRGYSSTYYNGVYDTQYIVNNGDILIGMDGDFNVGVWNGGMALLNQRVCKVTINETFYDSIFFRNIIQGYLDAINSYTSSVTVKHISSSTIKLIPIPLPPLAEQKYIGEVLETSIKRLKNIKNDLEETFLSVNALRKAAVKNAINGTLIKSDILSTNLLDIPKMKLGELGALERGKSKHRPRNDEKLYGGIYPFIQTGDIANADQEITSYNKTYSEFGLQQSKLFPTGTLCITIAANIADTAILSFPACFPDSVVGFIGNPNFIDTYFAKYFIDSIKDDLEAQAPATAQKNINLAILKGLGVPVPPIHLQKKIVQKVQAILELSKSIADRTKDVLSQIEVIIKSVVVQALEGNLSKSWRSDHIFDVSDRNSSTSLLASINRLQNELLLSTTSNKGKNQKMKSHLLENVVPILDVLKKTGNALSSQELFINAGYPNDSGTLEIEKFFLDVRENLSLGKINRIRRDDEDFFQIIDRD